MVEEEPVGKPCGSSERITLREAVLWWYSQAGQIRAVSLTCPIESGRTGQILVTYGGSTPGT